MDNILDVLKWVELHYMLDDMDEQHAVTVCPPGWHSLLAIAFSFRFEMAKSCKIHGLRVQKGLLRLYGSCHSSKEDEVWVRLAQSLAASSALICMVCGAKGYRRKLEAGQPCLCAKHYIEYANALGGLHEARNQEDGIKETE